MTKLYSLEVLEAIKEEFQNDNLAQEVIDEIETYGEEWNLKLNDIVNHGCISGTISRLIYYSQTNEFHDMYEKEIDDVISEYLENTGEDFHCLVQTFNFDVYDIVSLKNWKAWFSFEYVASCVKRFIEDNEFETLD